MAKNYCHKYSTEQKDFLRDHVSGRSYAELTELFNQEFGLGLNVGRISSAIKRYGLKNNRDGRFQKGNSAWNKGKKGMHLNPSTEFKKGGVPANHRPVGSERINADGYIEVKIAEPKTWDLKQRIVWKQEHGSIPEGNVVIFADGNPLNCNLNNLLSVSRAELLILNRQGLIKQDPDVTRAGVQVAKLIAKISEMRQK